MTGENTAMVPPLHDDSTEAADQGDLEDVDLLGAERVQREARDLVELRALRVLLRSIEEEGFQVEGGASCYGRA
jgi:hypothetical protein